MSRPEDPLPGDHYLPDERVLRRWCPTCALETVHRLLYDSTRGRMLLRCWRCGREREALLTRAGPAPKV